LRAGCQVRWVHGGSGSATVCLRSGSARCRAGTCRSRSVRRSRCSRSRAWGCGRWRVGWAGHPRQAGRRQRPNRLVSQSPRSCPVEGAGCPPTLSVTFSIGLATCRRKSGRWSLAFSSIWRGAPVLQDREESPPEPRRRAASPFPYALVGPQRRATIAALCGPGAMSSAVGLRLVVSGEGYGSSGEDRRAGEVAADRRAGGRAALDPARV
jgi:hypothetical protein